jgi:hypothetical protein
MNCACASQRSRLGELGLAPAIILGVQVGISAAGMLIQALRGRQAGRQKLQATAFVEQVEPLLVMNLEGFLSSPSREHQAAVLKDFDEAWQELRAACGDAALGDAGRRCISERARGGRFDWFAAYRDPVANFSFPAAAPAVAVSPAPGGSGNTAALVGLALIGAGVVWGWQ